jgi:hypothetical protein
MAYSLVAQTPAKMDAHWDGRLQNQILADNKKLVSHPLIIHKRPVATAALAFLRDSHGFRSDPDALWPTETIDRGFHQVF